MDQGAIKVQPLLKNPFSEGLFEVSGDTEVGMPIRHINRDSSKISMFARDGPECEGDPFDSLQPGPENRISEVY